MNKKAVLISLILGILSTFCIFIIIMQLFLPKELSFSFDLIGKVPICNRNADSTFHIGDFVFILCWRCTCMIGFYFIGLAILNLSKLRFKIKSMKPALLFILCCFLMFPLIIDGSLQYFCTIESTNFRRILTGSLFGIGISLLTTQLIFFLFEK